MNDARNQYGYPVPGKLEAAKQYAAGAAVRKQERECQCSRCRQAAEDERLQSVLNILEAHQ